MSTFKQSWSKSRSWQVTSMVHNLVHAVKLNSACTPCCVQAPRDRIACTQSNPNCRLTATAYFAPTAATVIYFLQHPIPALLTQKPYAVQLSAATARQSTTQRLLKLEGDLPPAKHQHMSLVARTTANSGGTTLNDLRKLVTREYGCFEPIMFELLHARYCCY